MLKKNQILNEVKLKKSNDPKAHAGQALITVSPSTKGAQILRLLSLSLPPEGKDRNILRNFKGF
jgi:hypothetical protein